MHAEFWVRQGDAYLFVAFKDVGSGVNTMTVQGLDRPIAHHSNEEAEGKSRGSYPDRLKDGLEKVICTKYWESKEGSRALLRECALLEDCTHYTPCHLL
jgi:hypothetical protein